MGKNKTLEVIFQAESDDSYLVLMSNIGQGTWSNKQWIPKKHCTVEKLGGNRYSLTAPTWLLEKLGVLYEQKLTIELTKGRWVINGKHYNELSEDEKMFFDRFIKEAKADKFV